MAKKEGAVRNDEIKELNTKARQLAAKHSPDLSKLQKVRIDHSTCIYIDPNKDPVLAKKRFIDKMNDRPMNIRYKNYDTDKE
jgi:hypothetical protein